MCTRGSICGVLPCDRESCTPGPPPASEGLEPLSRPWPGLRPHALAALRRAALAWWRVSCHVQAGECGALLPTSTLNPKPRLEDAELYCQPKPSTLNPDWRMRSSTANGSRRTTGRTKMRCRPSCARSGMGLRAWVGGCGSMVRACAARHEPSSVVRHDNTTKWLSAWLSGRL